MPVRERGVRPMKRGNVPWIALFNEAKTFLEPAVKTGSWPERKKRPVGVKRPVRRSIVTK